jgi:hypothetical protein
MGAWWQLAIALAVLWVVVRFLRNLFRRREPSEPVEDPLTGVLSPKRRGPQNRSGAGALAEPDDEDENRNFPPRTL